MTTDNASISTVIVLPRDNRFCYFYINGQSERHMKRIADTVDFVADLCPSLAGPIHKNIYDAVPILLDVAEKELIEIEPIPPQPRTMRSLCFGKEEIIKRFSKNPKATKTIMEKEGIRFTAIGQVLSNIGYQMHGDK